MAKVPEDLGIKGHLNGDADGFGFFRGLGWAFTIMFTIGAIVKAFL